MNYLNYKGIKLPETGGSGTKMFMIGGGVLLLAAAAFFVFYIKKRK